MLTNLRNKFTLRFGNRQINADVITIHYNQMRFNDPEQWRELKKRYITDSDEVWEAYFEEKKDNPGLVKFSKLSRDYFLKEAKKQEVVE